MALGARSCWDYKTHLKSGFAGGLVAEDGGFQDLGCDSPELQALFRAFLPDEHGFRPRTVVLHGEPGTGQALLVRRLLLGWAQDKALQDLFSYVFLLQAQDLRGPAESSLLKLLSRAWPAAPEAAQDIGAWPDRLLFVLDGFDDLDWTFGDEDGATCADWAAWQPVKVLLRSLLRKVLLPEASLLITASGTTLEMLKAVLVAPCYLWFGGFSLEQRLDLLLQHSYSEAQQRQILQWATHCQPLLENCQVPAMNHLLQEALHLRLATHNCTLTALYATWVFHQFLPMQVAAEMRDHMRPVWRHMLQALCRLALEGLRLQKLVFTQDTLGRFGLWSPHLSFLASKHLLLPHPHRAGHFSFLHPSLQDFFAALSHMLPEGQACPMFPELLSLLLPKSGGARHPPVSRFLCGLLNRELAELLQGLLGCAVAPETRQALLHEVAWLGAHPGPQDLLSTFYCLFETQEQELVQEMCASLRAARVLLSRPMDLLVHAFCLPCCGHLQTLRLSVGGVFQKDHSLEAGPLLPPRPQHQSLVRESWQQLCGVLGAHPSLRRLDLAGSILSPWALKTLCGQLQRPACGIQRLTFTDVQVMWGLEPLWHVLVASPRLRLLGLACMSLGHADVTMAGMALRHPSCRLRSLWLDGCWLEDPEFSVISQVLAGATCLRVLSLARNKVSKDALRALCQGLLAPACKLQRLEGLGWFSSCPWGSLSRLRSCGLSAGACQDLARGLIGNCSLTHLDLSDNHLSTWGMRFLYPCLSHSAPSHGLQRLLLTRCGLDTAACSFLALALMHHTSLTHLSLSSNPLGNRSVHLLCLALQDPMCHLQELELVQCQLTATCCSSLSSVIAQNQYLSSLDLSHNALGDEGLVALCEGLKQSTSSLVRLRLEECGLTSDSSVALSAALSQNRSLLSLGLASNSFSLPAMRTLFQGISHPSCALRAIGLKLGQFPAAVQQLVADLQQVKPWVTVDSDWDKEPGEDWDEEPDEDWFWWRQ
ncbi:NACHT, LRR and PYD domains-containing protein 5 [Sorex fumeus]|uniref:NACHT, LRR and PYD domains-containing protein 5 n=1 Tax=Sorex fumeus TaxID=62283 RepID=UPI0024AD3C9F|nr:NACHT, LRR and PYD domains-containing protein 5 [Sorex fumeus]